MDEKYNFESEKKVFDTFAEWQEFAYKNSLTDGAIVAPPEKQKVVEILDYLGRNPGESIGKFPPLNGNVTIEQIAIISVMCGCLPEYVPVVIAAVEALLAREFNMAGVQGTTNPVTPLILINGPIVKEIGINSKDGVFGSGFRSNTSIGRTVRLIIWILGGAKPGEHDKSTLAHPAKYCFCIGENEDESKWEPFHVTRGFAAKDNTVTVFGCHGPFHILLKGSSNRIINMITNSIPIYGVNMWTIAGQYMVVMSPSIVKELHDSKISKEKFISELYSKARFNAGNMKHANINEEGAGSMSYWGMVENPPDLNSFKDDELLPMVENKDDIHVVCAGGMSMRWSGFLPGWGVAGAYAVTKTITK